MKKSKSFSSAVLSLYKSLTGNQCDDEVKKNVGQDDSSDDYVKDDEDTEDDVEIEDDEDEADDEDSDYEDNAEDDSEDDSETDDDEDDSVDGTEVLKSLDYELTEMRKSMNELRKMNKDLGQAVVNLANMVSVIGNEKLPPKSTLSKSYNSFGTVQKSIAQKGRPTDDDLYRVQCILQDAVKEGKIDMIKSSMISSDMQKCMMTGQPMKKEYYEFLQKELNAKEAK